MSFPTVHAIAVGQRGTEGNNFTASFPSGVQDGDLIIVLATTSNDAGTNGPNATTTVMTRFFTTTNAAVTRRMIADYRWPAAGETGALYTTTNPACYVYVTLLIRGAVPGHAPAVASATPASSTSQDPPALDPPNWAEEDTLWLAILGGLGSTGVTRPTNYAAAAEQRLTTPPGMTVHACQRALWAASENPAEFVIGTAQPAVVGLIAVRGALDKTDAVGSVMG